MIPSDSTTREGAPRRPSGLLGQLWDRFAPGAGHSRAAPIALPLGSVAESPADVPVATERRDPDGVGDDAPVFVDLETRSALDLAEVGGHRYAVHPSTEILAAVALLPDLLVVWTPLLTTPLADAGLWPADYENCRIHRRPVRTFAGPSLPAPLADAVAAGRAFCAHNADGFDALVWRARGLPSPSTWIDTLPAARVAGLPGSLDEIGRRLFGRGKHEGAAAVKRLCRPDDRGGFTMPSREDTLAVACYCAADVLLVAALAAEVRGFCEPDVLAADRAINERGVAFDQTLARALIRLDERLAAETATAATEATGGAVVAGDLTRITFLLGWLRAQGVEIPNLQRETVEGLLATDALPPGPRAVLQARLAAARATGGKLKAALAALDTDGRLRRQFVFHAAHTGRWSSRGVQLQNLPRCPPDLRDLPALVAAADSPSRFRRLVPAGVSASAAVSALVRPCFRAAPGKLLCVADFASVEARGLAWCAGEQELIDRFAAGGDVYCDLATRLFGRSVTPDDKRERAVGKTAVLGCGYGMSAARFAEHARRAGIDLAALSVTAEEVVNRYRAAYPAIAGFRTDGDGEWREGGIWQRVDAVARGIVLLGEPSGVARCALSRDRNTLIVQLPSGRCLRYRNARVEYAAPPGREWGARPTLFYDNPRNGAESTYGGKLVENIVQAVCRDLLAAALVACEREGLPVVLHVHDEIVVEVPAADAERALVRLVEIMSRAPEWAAGLPIEVEGFASERYYDSPVRGAVVVRGRDGRVISRGVAK